MQLTVKIKLLPDKEQSKLLDTTLKDYISLINDILDCALAIDDMPTLSSGKLKVDMPSALKDQCRRDASSAWAKYKKGKQNFPILKKPAAIWNNQNYTVNNNSVEVPLWVDGKCKKTKISAVVTQRVWNILSAATKIGTLRITKKNNKFIAQVSYESVCLVNAGSGEMGVDLGIKCPAVARTSNGKTKFFGNGRQRKQKRRKYKARRKSLGKAKNLKKIKAIGNKEQRWMANEDHITSKQIVEFASKNGVKTIKLEELAGIRATTRQSRKNNYGLHDWSFYRLAKDIEYKAALKGIDVQYVNPAYTSQRCPCCGTLNHAKDRTYKCKCGFKGHRDVVGAMNILIA